MSKYSPLKNIEAFKNWAGNSRLKKEPEVKPRIKRNQFLDEIDPLDSTYLY